jgi:tagatose 1,6-diphosphate aldolase
VKLLAYFDVQDQKATEHQVHFVEGVANECAKWDILLMIEELSYPRPGETKQDASYKSRLADNIFKSAEILNDYADILKLEFPGDIVTDSAKTVKANLAQLNRIAKRPWVLLSAGVKFDLFAKQVELAMRAGCSGTMAGRAIFQEYFDQPTPAGRKKFLLGEGVKRMKKLNAIVDKFAQPWMKRYQITEKDLAASVASDWYMSGEKILNGHAAAWGPERHSDRSTASS